MPLFTSSITAPSGTTTYASGDLIANSATAGSVTVPRIDLLSTGGTLQRAALRTNNATIANGSFRAWLLNDTTTVTNGDDSALAGVTMTKVIDYLDFTLAGSISGNGGIGRLTAGSIGLLELGGSIYWLLEARGAYARASSEVFTLDLWLGR